MEKRRVNTRAIIYKDGKILAVKHRGKNGEASSYWALPGGGLDPLESLEDGLRREITEELGVTASVGRLLFGQQLKSSRAGRDEELEFFYHVTNAEDFSNIDLSKTSHGFELAAAEFIDPRTEYILPKFLSEVNIEQYVESVQPVFIKDYLDGEFNE